MGVLFLFTWLRDTMSDYYEKVGVENNDSSDDESVPLFKPEVPYTGSSTLMRKFRALTPSTKYCRYHWYLLYCFLDCIYHCFLYWNDKCKMGLIIFLELKTTFIIYINFILKLKK